MAAIHIEQSAAWSTHLSPEQLRFYFLHQLDPHDPDIYITRVLRIRGAVDHERLRESVLEMARRHDILRSYYPEVDGQPQIWLRDNVDSAFTSCDELPREAPAFSLETGPLFHVTAVKLSDTEHVIVFRCHHIILDGTSVRLLMDGVLQAYQGKHLDTSHQFREFLSWDRGRDDTEGYWARKLAHPTTLDLTIGKQRPECHTREAGTVHLAIGDELVASLERFCRAHHVTPYVVMMTVLQSLVHQLTGERDVLIGSPMAARERREFRGMLGVLLNWVALRATIDPEPTFAQMLARVRTDVPHAYMRQCSYQSLLAAAGNLPRDPSHNPLLQVTLNYATYQPLDVPPGWSVELEPIDNKHTRYDLAVRFEQVGRALSLGLTYYAGAMNRRTAERLAAAFIALLEQCLARPRDRIPDVALHERRIVVAATFTAEPIQPIVEYWLDQIGLPADVAFASFNQVFQELVDPNSLFARNSSGPNVVLVRCDDWKEPDAGAAELCRLLAAYAERSRADTIVVLCPSSAADERVEKALAEVADASPRIHFLSWRTITALYPVADIADVELEAPYAQSFYAALGTAVARNIHAVVRPAPKVLVLDCDNTLWRGVVGEDGAHCLVVDAGHRALQQLAIDQLAQGVLVCLASKNNEADVWEAFETTPGMLLRKDMIVAHRINWEPKSANLRSLAQELNLGIDSFVFIDDSAAECAEVQAGCPDALVLQLPTEIERFVKHLWPLDARKVTETDRQRTELYVANARREHLRKETPNLDQFIASLDVQTRFVPFSPATAARAAQLTQRTNQFNTTTIRRTAAELEAIITSGGHVLLADVSDRFGDYGIVGLVVCMPGDGVLYVDSFMLSCRALGRGVEQRMLAELGRIADAAGFAVVAIDYRASAKNQPARRFLEAIAGASETPYRIPVAAAIAARPVAIEVVEDAKPRSTPHDDARASHEVWRRIAALDTVAAIREAISAALTRPRVSTAAFVAPRSGIERAIAAIWADVLLVECVGVEDDYFSIGGDSIRSLAVIAAMRAAGLTVSVRDLHERRTIARLASAIEHRTALPMTPVDSATDGPYPLSFAQRYMIAAYTRENLQQQPSGAFHIQDRLTVRERRRPHSIAALRRAIALLVRRRPILRTKIVGNDRQVEVSARDPLDVIDLSALDADQQQTAINELLFADRMQSFHPQRDLPMIRLYVVVLDDTAFDLLVTAHHAFCDGWSLQTFYNHLFALYEAYKRGDDAAVAEIDRELAATEHLFRELVHKERVGAAEHDLFWRDRHVSVRTHRFDASGYQQRMIRHASWSLVERASERARASRTSLKAVLLDAFAAVLARRLPLPLIAVVTNGRQDDLSRPMDVFGLCWTFVPIAARHDLERSARLAALHADLIATEAHARYPIEGMFGGCDPRRVAHASFNFANFHNATWRNGTADLEITQAESFHRFHFPLNFNIRLVESTRSLLLKLHWAADVFTTHDVHALLEDFTAEVQSWG